ncbi:IFNL3 protein, partial [Nothoprocta pentlandii]|nr:IFNL3 protein [Nothoprocta pentlandii]
QPASGQSLLLLLLLLGTSLLDAFPHNASQKSCGLSKYHFLLPSELKLIQDMKEQFEETMLLSDRKCNTRVFHRKWKTAELSVPDRVLLVEAELDLVMEALGHPTAPGLAERHRHPLSFLAQAREDLRGCVSVSPASPHAPVLPATAPGLTDMFAPQAPKHQPSGKLRHWLHKLEVAKERETDGCLEASAILHLFQVLSDLKCAALREECP